VFELEEELKCYFFVVTAAADAAAARMHVIPFLLILDSRIVGCFALLAMDIRNASGQSCYNGSTDRMGASHRSQNHHQHLWLDSYNHFLEHTRSPGLCCFLTDSGVHDCCPRILHVAVVLGCSDLGTEPVDLELFVQ
jgi:hypothetical protein